MFSIDGPQQVEASSCKINHLVEKNISPYLKATYWVRAQTERESGRWRVMDFSPLSAIWAVEILGKWGWKKSRRRVTWCKREIKASLILTVRYRQWMKSGTGLWTLNDAASRSRQISTLSPAIRRTAALFSSSNTCLCSDAHSKSMKSSTGHRNIRVTPKVQL